MKENNKPSSSLFSGNSPWRDGQDPIFETGTFATISQHQLQLQQMNQKYIPYDAAQRIIQNIDQTSAPGTPSNLNTNRPLNMSGNVFLGSRSQFASQRYGEEIAAANNAAFQSSVQNLLSQISTNLVNIIQGVQKNVASDVNKNMRHQMKKQRYLLEKQHEELIDKMKDQDIIRGATFNNLVNKRALAAERIKSSDGKIKESSKESHGSNKSSARSSQNNTNKQDISNDKTVQRRSANDDNDIIESKKTYNISKNSAANVTNSSINSGRVPSGRQQLQQVNKSGNESSNESSTHQNNSHANTVKIQKSSNKQASSKDNISDVSNGPAQQETKSSKKRKFDDLFEEIEENPSNTKSKLNSQQNNQTLLKESRFEDGLSLAYTIDDENNRNSFLNKEQSVNRLSTVVGRTQVVKSKLYKDDDDLDDIADIELAYRNTEKENISNSNNFSDLKSVSAVQTGNNNVQKNKMDINSNASNVRKKQYETNVEEEDDFAEYDLDEFNAEELAESVLAKSQLQQKSQLGQQSKQNTNNNDNEFMVDEDEFDDF